MKEFKKNSDLIMRIYIQPEESCARTGFKQLNIIAVGRLVIVTPKCALLKQKMHVQACTHPIAVFLDCRRGEKSEKPKGRDNLEAHRRR